MSEAHTVRSLDKCREGLCLALLQGIYISAGGAGEETSLLLLAHQPGENVPPLQSNQALFASEASAEEAGVASSASTPHSCRTAGQVRGRLGS